jgi:carbon-monoxide dehydrogenase medium subunit
MSIESSRFVYRRARSLDEAIALLQNNDGARVIAGGQSLMPMINLRLAAPTMLVDIGRIRDLDYVRAADGVLEVGALTRHSTLEESATVKRHCPLLSAAASHIAHMQVRNRGTIGGSLSHADPAAELPLAALVLGATIRTRGPQGGRDIAAEDFFRGALTTALRPGELVESIGFPLLDDAQRWSFLEQVRRHGDFPLVAVAVVLRLGAGKIQKPVLAFGGVAATPVRAKKAEAALAGQTPTGEVLAQAALTAANELDPGDTVHASAAYRRQMAAVYARRALEAASGLTGR